MTDNLIDSHLPAETFQQLCIKMLLSNLFSRFGASAQNFKNGRASIDVVLNQFRCPACQLNTVPLVIVI